ncbi:MAG: ATP synthase F1 subunit gamma [Anaerolineae bacterium]|uniref:ATP synthase F1 subunit gamma n=1 Tax=Promineifilum sp. TaxID=2664178 RepID=UPI001DEE9DC9|nr:ATP synthase F1 subunit gamma [Anaerolineales bacterium]MCB8935514.1 ATP synthase F1 subunit gamma [Promineifilum sp.]MCO5180567.1 ATP synthase F1 subunit gamma [Promineifilum sp.]MCW5847274.1 ATP synthase F1 subunit gamma [Anaerolineae bacterium]
MANERELNKRIKSVKNISQVTSALAAVSASKASRAQRQAEATRHYAQKAFEIIQNLAAQPGASATTHPLMMARDDVRTIGLVLLTSDRGLAGSYNVNMVTLAERFLAAAGKPAKVIAVGRKGRDGMVRRGYNVIAAFDRVPDPPSFLDITPIARVIIDSMLSGEVDQVFIGYSEYVNLVTRQPVIHQLLPLKPADLSGMPGAEYVSGVDSVQASQQSYTYEPSAEALLSDIVPRFTRLQVYQSLLEALASEHSARMVAMNNATDNAAELVDILTLERNKARQASITNEILDIVGGAEALKNM